MHADLGHCIIGFMQRFWLLYVLIAVISANRVQVSQKDVEFSKMFLEEMNAKVIGQTLKSLHLISPEVATDIERARSKKEANNALLQYMQEDADEERLRKIFEVASTAEGYGRMNNFAASVLRNWQWGLYLHGLYI